MRSGVKQYKFQALVRIYTDGDGRPLAALGAAPRRVVLRGRNEDSGRSQVYNALVSCDDDGPFRPGGHRLLVTLRLAGDDVTEYLRIGGHFGMWLGCDVGEGVVTRRLFV